ncbi:hypothetical protein CB1_000318017 [Camelus ferus]|nr:hypothetical protein CB1_000318017 [Camelus ferus]
MPSPPRLAWPAGARTLGVGGLRAAGPASEIKLDFRCRGRNSQKGPSRLEVLVSAGLGSLGGTHQFLSGPEVEAYEELFWRRRIKCVRQVRRDNYDALRSVLFQIFSQGLSFPSWMKEKDIVKWTEFSGIKDYHKRGSMCNSLFSDALLEYKLYEALKFIMLYQVTEVYEQMKTKKAIPSPFRLLFTRETSSDPLSFMMNHLNSVGDTCGLEQIDMFILGYSLEVKIKVFRLFKFNSRDFEVCYPEESLREWPEISLLTENDRHYHIPVF